MLSQSSHNWSQIIETLAEPVWKIICPLIKKQDFNAYSADCQIVSVQGKYIVSVHETWTNKNGYVLVIQLLNMTSLTWSLLGYLNPSITEYRGRFGLLVDSERGNILIVVPTEQDNQEQYAYLWICEIERETLRKGDLYPCPVQWREQALLCANKNAIIWLNAHRYF